MLTTPTTEQLEYRFLRRQLAGLPNCTVAGVSRAGRRQWAIPSFLSPGDSAQRSVQAVSDLAAAPGACLLYVRGSICSSADGRELCEAIERDVSLDRVAGAAFPAVPSYDGMPYDRDAVETVVFRVRGHRLGVGDGVAITPAFADAVYARLTALRAADGCRLIRADTSRFRISAILLDRAGAEHPVELAIRPSGGADAWMAVASDRAERQCADSLAALRRGLAELGPPAAEERTLPTG
jgi:hypothetical protein